MKIAVTKEVHKGETRVPLVPATVKKIADLGAEITIESGLGESCGFADTAYEEAGAKVNSNREELLQTSDIVLRLRKPPVEEIPLMKKGALHVSYLDPFNEESLVTAMQEAGVNGVSLEMIPRTTVAQKMDVLSSQANLGGYVTVILAA